MTDLHYSDLTTKLREKIKQLGERSFFNEPASIKDIEKLEKITRLRLPDNLKAFYLNFNGGFFAESFWTEYDLKDEKTISHARWNSNYILSVDDIIKSYNFEEGSLSSCDIQEEEEHTGKRFLSFLHTSGQEMFVLDATNIATKTPILDAFHEVNADE